MSDIIRRPAVIRAVSVLASVLLVSVLVVRTSQAAFTADHTNSGNEFAAATIALDDNETLPLFGDLAGGNALVEAHGLRPGEAIQGCLDITYTGDLAAAELTTVKFNAAADAALAAGLADQLSVTVTPVVDCTTGTADGAAVTHSLADWTNGTAGVIDSGWTPANDADVQGFRFDVTFQTTGSDAGDNGLQGETVSGVNFTWSIASV